MSGERALIEIRYASRRSEVWAWYWKAWRQGLWRVHLAFIILAFGWAFLVWRAAPVAEMIIRALVMSAVGLLAFILIPQLLFKPQERTLTVDDKGVSTVIGRKSGARTWREIASIVDEGDVIVLKTVKQNAFIVPRRAFATEGERGEFLKFIEAAKAAASVAS